MVKPLYWGKRVENELTSNMPLSFHEGSNLSTFQWSMLGSSHGLSLSCFPLCLVRFFSPSSPPPFLLYSSSKSAIFNRPRALKERGREKEREAMREGLCVLQGFRWTEGFEPTKYMEWAKIGPIYFYPFGPNTPFSSTPPVPYLIDVTYLLEY